MRSVNLRRVIQTCGLTLVATAALLAAAPHTQAQEGEEAGTSTEKVAILKTNLGEIVLRFFPEVAPGHVENFLSLAADGFYNGVKFHRVIPGFMIQGGDPNSKDEDRANDGIGGSGTQIKAEFSSLPHRRGVLSMARGGNPDSASSQFFICVGDSPFLDNKYSAFGMVVEGMDVADAIVNLQRDRKDNPLPGNPALIESVVIEERAIPARPEWAQAR